MLPYEENKETITRGGQIKRTYNLAFEEMESVSSAKRARSTVPCQVQGSGEDLGMMVELADAAAETAIEQRQDQFFLLQDMPSRCNVIIGDFNVNWMNELERRLLHNLFVTERKYKQLISHYTTDNRTVIDHIYTNIPDLYLTSGILETYFTDHKESGHHFHLLSINENFPEIQHYLPKICSHYFLLH